MYQLDYMLIWAEYKHKDLCINYYIFKGIEKLRNPVKGNYLYILLHNIFRRSNKPL